MNKLRTIILLLLLVFSLTLVQAEWAYVEEVEIEAPDQSPVDEKVELSGNIEGNNLEGAVIEVKENSWWAEIESRSCTGTTCSITSEYETESEVEKEFRVYAWGGSSDGQAVKSVNFVEEDDPNEAFFDVDITGTNTPVVQGEALEVDYSVENTGGAQGEQDIVLTADGEERDSISTLLSAGLSTSGTLEWDTESVESGWYDVEVSSDDDSDTEWVYVQEKEDEEWNIVSSSAQHVGDGEVEMDLELDNDFPSDYTCRWSRNSGISISDEVMDREDDRNFEASASFSEGSHSVWMGCLDGSGSLVTDVVEESFTVDIDDEAFFDVEITGTNSPVEEEETLEVDYSVENTGDESDTQRLELELDGDRKDSRWISLSGGSETSGTFEWETEVSDAGSYIATVRSDDSEDSRSVTVNGKEVERPEITSFTSTVDERDVDFDLRLDRDAAEDLTCRWSRNQDITISDDLMDRETDSRFSYSRSFDPGTYTVYAGCLDGAEQVTGTASTTFTVEEKEASASFLDVSADPNILEGSGSTSDLEGVIENTGDLELEGQLEFTVGGESVGSHDVQLQPDEQESFDDAVSYDTLIAKGLGLEQEHEVVASLDFDTGLIQQSADEGIILEDEDPDEAFFQVTSLTSNTPVTEGEEFVLEYQIENTGEASAIKDVEVEAGESESFLLDLDPGEVEEREFTWESQEGDSGSYTARVSTEDSLMEKDFEVVESGDATVSADFSFSPVSPGVGEEVEFDASGSEGPIDEFNWDFDDGLTAEGETVTHSFESEGDFHVTLEVASEEDSDSITRTVTVSDEPDPDRFNLDVTVRERSTSDPIEDARVTVAGATRETDSDGNVDFTVDRGTYDLFVSREGYRSVSREEIEMDRNRGLEVHLEREVDEVDDVTISSVNMPSSVCRGESVDADVELENTGEASRLVTLSASGISNEIDRSLVLSGGERRTVSLSFLSVQGLGNEQVEFTTGDDSRTRTIQVRDCEEAEQKLSVNARPSQVRIGDSIRVSGYADNIDRKEQIDIYVGGRLKGSTTSRPDGYYQKYVNPDRTGDQTVRVEAGDAQATTRIDVLPTVRVNSASGPQNVFEGDEYEVCADVDSQVAPLVVLKRDGEEVDSKYGRGEVCFERRSSPGEYSYEVEAWARGQRSSKSTTVEVLEMDSEARSFPDQIASVRSGSGMAKIELYNTREELQNYEIEVTGVPEDWVSQNRKRFPVDTGDRDTAYIYFTPKEEGSFTATLNVRAEGETIYTEDVRIRSGGSDRPPEDDGFFNSVLRFLGFNR